MRRPGRFFRGLLFVAAIFAASAAPHTAQAFLPVIAVPASIDQLPRETQPLIGFRAPEPFLTSTRAKADEGAANAAFQEADAHGAGVARDLRDVESLYQLLEKQMVGEFYDRGRDGLPRKWIKRALASAATIPDFFSTNRMVSEYATRAYGA